MVAKVKLSLDTKKLEKLIDKSKKRSIDVAKKEGVRVLKKEIIKSIEKGRSPVARAGKFKSYKPSYKEAMSGGPHFRKIRIGGNLITIPLPGGDPYLTRYGKKPRPVNLKVTGKLHKSLRVRLTKRGISAFFTSSYAKYHQGSTRNPNIKERKLLPQNNENFNRNITTIYIKRVGDKLFKTFRSNFK